MRKMTRQKLKKEKRITLNSLKKKWCVCKNDMQMQALFAGHTKLVKLKLKPHYQYHSNADKTEYTYGYMYIMEAAIFFIISVSGSTF